MTEAPMLTPCSIHMPEFMQAAAFPSGQAGHPQPHTCIMRSRNECRRWHTYHERASCVCCCTERPRSLRFNVVLKFTAACVLDLARPGCVQCQCLGPSRHAPQH